MGEEGQGPKRVVYKYELPVELEGGTAKWNDGFDMKLPAGAQLLAVDATGTQAVLYALVDPENPPEVRSFRMYQTGKEFPDDALEHVGTFGTTDRAFVLHVFEVRRGFLH